MELAVDKTLIYLQSDLIADNILRYGQIHRQVNLRRVNSKN